MKILCVLYDDPKDGMPTSYPVRNLPELEKYPDGMTLPNPKAIDFTPGELLGCSSLNLICKSSLVVIIIIEQLFLILILNKYFFYNTHEIAIIYTIG